MAKLDANGRPIYETAEEYNRAHGTGSARRTYDSPEGENYKHTTYKETRSYERAAARQMKSASPRNAKNTKKVIIICAVILIFVNMAVISLMYNVVGGVYDGVYESYDEDWVDLEEDEGYGEYIGNSDAPLVEGFGTFTYNGVNYSIPMTYEELSQMGFTLEESYDADFTIYAQNNELIILNGDDGYMAGMARLNNYTEEDIPLDQCIVDYFYLSSDLAYDEEASVPDFVFGNGLTMKSTYEDLEACFGTPYYQYIDEDEEYGCYESYEWVYDSSDEYHCLMVNFWDGVISDVSIEKYKY